MRRARHPYFLSTPLAVILLFLMVAPMPSFAQAEVAGWIAAGYTGKRIVDEAKKLSTQIFNDAENTGNALFGRFGTEMSVLIQMIESSAARQLDKAVKDLDDQSKKIFYKLDEIRLAAMDAQNRAYEEKEAALVDFASRVGDLPFAQDPVFIQAILGIAHLRSDQPYPFTVIATGLGPGTADRESSLKLYINGQLVSPDSVDPSKSNRLIYRIKNQDLAKHFKEENVSLVKARLVLTLRKKTFLWTKTYTVDAPFTLALFPLFAGRATVQVEEPAYDWQFLKTSDNVWVSPDCGEGKCNVTHQLQIKAPGGNVSALGSQRLVNLRRNCVPLWGPRACEWSYEQAYGINADHSVGLFVVRHDGERVRWTLTADVEQYTQVGYTTTSRNLALTFGSNFSFTIPSDSRYFKIAGKTLTGRKIELAKDQVDQTALISRIGDYEVPPNLKRYEFRVNMPSW